LSDLDCSYNQLSSLTLSGCAGLSDLDCSYNQLSSLEVDGCTALGSLDCSSNQLTKLDLSTNTALRTLICDNNQLSVLELASLREITCWENRLQLSDLYKASKMIYESGNTVEMISLGIQKLPSREVFIGDAIDFSAQNQFPMIVFPYNWINTIFTVEKNGILAPQNDYTIFSGIITFKNIGNYTIKMTNTTIISNPFSPAQVVAEFKVRDIADATLAGLTVSAGKLTPVFSPTNLNYTVDADASVFFVTITAIPTNSNATISGDTGLQKLVSGATFFTITVIAEDGVTTQEYNIIVRSYRLHTDATLSNLTISAGKLAPPFRSTTVNYAANVEYEDSLVTITATPTSANAEVSGDGLKRLQVGINSFTITVTAEDGFITSNYRVNLNRLSKTGITNSTQEASTIQIYIDPTHNQLRITNYKLRDEEIEIFDVLGRKQNVVAKYILPSTEATIDISHLQAGIYYIRINNKLNKILKL
jgi:Leucine-rich repeat (LRR) protein